MSGAGIFGNEDPLPDENACFTTSEGKEAKGGNLHPFESSSSSHSASSITPTWQTELVSQAVAPAPLFCRLTQMSLAHCARRRADIRESMPALGISKGGALMVGAHYRCRPVTRIFRGGGGGVTFWASSCPKNFNGIP